MRTIYTVVLVCGLYTDGQTTSMSPIPMPHVECLSVARNQEQTAKCVRLDWPTEFVDPEMLFATGGALDE